MSSLRRIQSSRANGAKSRGPATPAGRQKSARNNLRHGLLAECVVLEDEKTEIFNDILADLTREFNPKTEAQRGLVETMAAARWRLFRIWNIERETLLSEIEKHDDGKRPESRPAYSFRVLAEQSNILDVLHRYEVRFDRQYARALNLLLKLAAPESPLAQFCQTNPVPESDTPADVPPQPADQSGVPGNPPVPPGFIEPAAENLAADKEDGRVSLRRADTPSSRRARTPSKVAQASSPAQALVLRPNAAPGSHFGASRSPPGPWRRPPPRPRKPSPKDSFAS